jgi:hypothetical protein
VRTQICQEFDLVIIEDDAYYWLQASELQPYGQRFLHAALPAQHELHAPAPCPAPAPCAAPGLPARLHARLLLCPRPALPLRRPRPQWGEYGSAPGLGLPPSFLSLDTDGRVVRVDTFAKTLGPGYRLGWVTGPQPLVDKLALHSYGVVVGPSSFSQVGGRACLYAGAGASAARARACTAGVEGLPGGGRRGQARSAGPGAALQVAVHAMLQAWGEPGFDAFLRKLQRQYGEMAALAHQEALGQLAGLAEWRPVRVRAARRRARPPCAAAAAAAGCGVGWGAPSKHGVLCCAVMCRARARARGAAPSPLEAAGDL